MPLSHYQKPARLLPGDTIGIVSPSSTIFPFPRRLQRAILSLEELGFRVRLSEHSKAHLGEAAGTPQQRADDINNFFKDPDIKAIVCSTGGYSANAILPLINYEQIAKNPKIFCGYSDITALTLAISAQSHIVTFNGPTLLPTFGEFGGASSFTNEHFKKVLCSPLPIGKLPSSTAFSDENLWWEKEDDRKSTMQPAKPITTIHTGLAKGILLGGNLETLTILGGTKYMPDFTGSILFLEEMGSSASIVERNLIYLEQLGVFEKVSGLIYGRTYQFNDNVDRPLDRVLAELADKYDLPAVANVDCSHTSPMLTVPLGVHVELDATQKTITVTESAVL